MAIRHGLLTIRTDQFITFIQQVFFFHAVIVWWFLWESNPVQPVMSQQLDLRAKEPYSSGRGFAPRMMPSQRYASTVSATIPASYPLASTYSATAPCGIAVPHASSLQAGRRSFMHNTALFVHGFSVAPDSNRRRDSLVCSSA